MLKLIVLLGLVLIAYTGGKHDIDINCPPYQRAEKGNCVCAYGYYNLTGICTKCDDNWKFNGIPCARGPQTRKQRKEYQQHRESHWNNQNGDDQPSSNGCGYQFYWNGVQCQFWPIDQFLHGIPSEHPCSPGYVWNQAMLACHNQWDKYEPWLLADHDSHENNRPSAPYATGFIKIRGDSHHQARRSRSHEESRHEGPTNLDGKAWQQKWVAQAPIAGNPTASATPYIQSKPVKVFPPGFINFRDSHNHDRRSRSHEESRHEGPTNLDGKAWKQKWVAQAPIAGNPTASATPYIQSKPVKVFPPGFINFRDSHHHDRRSRSHEESRHEGPTNLDGKAWQQKWVAQAPIAGNPTASATPYIQSKPVKVFPPGFINFRDSHHHDRRSRSHEESRHQGPTNLDGKAWKQKWVAQTPVLTGPTSPKTPYIQNRLRRDSEDHHHH